MKSRAAVAFASGEPLEIVDVDLEGPKAGEVLIAGNGAVLLKSFTVDGMSGITERGVF